MGIETSEGDITSDRIVSKLLDSKESSSGEAFLGKKKKYYKNNKKSSERKCYNCGSKNHMRNACNKLKNVSTKESGNANNAFSAFFSRNDNSDCWYMDSGTSNHMTPNKKMLTDIKSANINDIISANNSKMHVNGISNLNLKINNSKINVNNVLHTCRI